MPARRAYERLEMLPMEERMRHEGPFQSHWYAFVAERLAYRQSLLDVGAGSGYGLEIYREAGAREVFGIDLLPLGAHVHALAVEERPDKSFDIVTAIDVIEHVLDDRNFFDHLCRIARSAVFLSTPNYLVSQGENPFHAREYTPDELRELVGDRKVEVYTASGDKVIRSHLNGFGTVTADPQDANFGVLVWIS